MFKGRGAHLVLLFAVALAVYANAFGNRFVWDDYSFIVDEPAIRTLWNLPDFFTQGTQNLYRPLRTALYAVTYHFSGLDPIGYHIVGKTLNALTVCVLYLLMVELFGSPAAAFWAALLFAVHPVHTEKVTLITSTYDILGDFLWLSAFLGYVVFRRTGRTGFFAASLVLFSGGLLSAENAAVIPLLIVLFDLTLGARDRKTRNWLPFFAVLGAYLVLRTSVLGFVARTGEGTFTADPVATLMTMSGVVAHYFRLLFVPWPLVCVPEWPVAASPYPLHLYAAALGVGVAIGTALLGMRKNPAASFSLLWFFVALSPNLNLIPTGTVMAERYLYLPSASLAFFAALLVTHPLFREDSAGARRRRTGYIAACLAVAALFSALTIRRNRDWRDETALWTATLKEKPNSYIAITNLAAELLRLGRHGEREAILHAAVAAYPNKGEAFQMLGEVYLEQGKWAMAEPFFKKAMETPHLRSKALLNLAAIRFRQKRFPEAKSILEGLLEQHPDSTMALNNYGVLLYAQGRPGWWVPYLRIHRLTGNPVPLVTVAEGFLENNNLLMAERFARIGLSVDPANERLRSIAARAGEKK